MKIAKDGTALVVIDMQNGFCHKGGSVDRIGLDISMLVDAIAPCATLIKAARGAGVPVIYTRYVYRTDYADGGILVEQLMPQLKQENALAAGSWDAEIVDELMPAPGDIVIDKNRPSSFYAPAFPAALSERGIGSLVVCGVTTNCCVESTVRDASQRDMPTFVVADATAELELQRHQAALATMGMLFAEVVGVEDVLSAWGT